MKKLSTSIIRLRLRMLSKALAILSISACMVSCGNNSNNSDQQEADSIAAANKQDSLDEVNAMQKHIEDSIAKVKTDSIAKADSLKNVPVKPQYNQNKPMTKYGVPVDYNDQQFQARYGVPTPANLDEI